LFTLLRPLCTPLFPYTTLFRSEQLLRDTLDLYAQHVPPDHQYVASSEHYLGEAYLAQRKFAAASEVLGAAAQRWTRAGAPAWRSDRKSTRLNSSHVKISYAVFC